MAIVLKCRAFLGGVIREPGYVADGRAEEDEARAYPAECWFETSDQTDEDEPDETADEDGARRATRHETKPARGRAK